MFVLKNISVSSGINEDRKDSTPDHTNLPHGGQSQIKSPKQL